MARVYVLFHETNTGHTDDSDGYVEAVYATEEAAKDAKFAAIRAAVAQGLRVWEDPDLDEDVADSLEWDHDWQVHPHEVLTVAEVPIELGGRASPDPNAGARKPIAGAGVDDPGKLVEIEQPNQWGGVDVRTPKGVARWWPEDGRRVVAVLMNPGEVLAWTTTITDSAPEHVFAVAWSSAQNEVRP